MVFYYHPIIIFFYDNNNFKINLDTCCIEILIPFTNSEDIQGKYIKELDNSISKNYLNLRIKAMN